jgi:hypothetical protein
MTRNILRVVAIVIVANFAACGGKASDDFKGGAGGSGPTDVPGNGPLAVGTPGSSTGLVVGADGGPSSSVPGYTGGVTQDCPGGGSTTISGTVYDPSIQDPLYNVTVYVPVSATLPALPSGASCNSCASLYPPILASTVTDATGHFTIPDAPWGKNVPLVLQTGKWRILYNLPSVASCKDNPQPDKTLRLPRNTTEGSLPDIAISTGGADSLECLPLRIGVDASEYVAGVGTGGHIHIFHGAKGANTTPASPESFDALWDTSPSLMKHDVVILSCEGAETANVTDANRQSLSDYAGAGGRVFASHFHYSWLNRGVFGADNLATWTPGAQELDDTLSFPGDVVTTLLNGGAFPEGAALKQWLGVVNALTNGQLQIFFARHNADVGPMNTPSQPWISLDPSVKLAPNGTEYFSFDTPIGMSPPCGRVVYSDLHVSGGPDKNAPGVPPDYPEANPQPTRMGGRMAADAPAGIVPSGCASHPLTPQEKALEFMLFDLSSCLIPVGKAAVPATIPR